MADHSREKHESGFLLWPDEGKDCSIFTFPGLIKCQEPADRSCRSSLINHRLKSFHDSFTLMWRKILCTWTICLSHTSNIYTDWILHAMPKYERLWQTETVTWLEKSGCLKRISIYQNGQVADNNLECNYFNYYEKLLCFLENIPLVLTQLDISANQPFH